MNELIKKAENTHKLSKTEIIKLLKDDSINKELFEAADRVRKKYVGDEIHLRALIEFSNVCKGHCAYCGLRIENKAVERYTLREDEILECAENAVKLGYKTLVLQSGESVSYSTEKLASIIKKLKKFDTAITLSIGEKTQEEYQMLKDAGADRFLLRIETTDKDLYEKMHPQMDWQNRKNCLYELKKTGFETGSGCLVGLPEQTTESLADDILFFKELNADMIGIGPLIAHPETPLKDAPNGDFWLALKVMALTRLLLPKINIPATTAMETLHPNGRLIALQSGANVVMPNVTDDLYREKYSIYPNKNSYHDSLEEYRKMITCKIESIGRTISKSRGDSKNLEK